MKPWSVIVDRDPGDETEPVMRFDGLCARRGCHEPLPLLAVRDGDCFCSMKCCRVHHRLPLLGAPLGLSGKKKAA